MLFSMDGVMDILLGAKVEICIFLGAFLAHNIVFRSHPFGIGARKAKEYSGGATQKVGSCAATLSPAAPSGEPVPLGVSVDSALRSGEEQLLQEALAQAGAAARAGLIKNLGSQKRLRDCFTVFEACLERTTGLYNALMDACASSRDVPSAARVFEWAREVAKADVATYNAMVKVYLHGGNGKRARAVVEDMQAAGISPDCATYNALLDFAIHGHGKEVWSLVSEMQAQGVKPNQSTCSSLLKTITKSSKPNDLQRVLAVFGDMQEAMGEGLFCSLCEACVRCGNRDHLAQLLEKRQSGCIRSKAPHTYDTIIRAHGYVNDLSGAWAAWNDMKARNVIPTCVTLGCMVEALASNSDPEAGHALIRQFMDSPQRRPLVNAVIYCSVLKGMSHLKKFDRVWAIHEEMKAERMQFSISNFNALIDACSRSGDMGRIPALLQEMATAKIDPNVITYSTVIKSYCMVDGVDRAFELLGEMKNCHGLRPDEVTYNTVLDGCARYGSWDQGLALLQEMREDGVAPSNFTLSVLVKLAKRSARPEDAFKLTEELSAQYKIRLNVHVFNNLIHVCTSIDDLPRAFKVVERMMREKVHPDARTYLLLIRGCFRVKSPKQIAALLYAAGGCPGAHWAFGGHSQFAQPRGGLPADVVSEALESVARTDEALAAGLVQELQNVRGLPVDPRVAARVAKRTRRF